jgi:hypothetical protein
VRQVLPRRRQLPLQPPHLPRRCGEGPRSEPPKPRYSPPRSPRSDPSTDGSRNVVEEVTLQQLLAKYARVSMLAPIRPLHGCTRTRVACVHARTQRNVRWVGRSLASIGRECACPNRWLPSEGRMIRQAGKGVKEAELAGYSR